MCGSGRHFATWAWHFCRIVDSQQRSTQTRSGRVCAIREEQDDGRPGRHRRWKSKKHWKYQDRGKGGLRSDSFGKRGIKISLSTTLSCTVVDMPVAQSRLNLRFRGMSYLLVILMMWRSPWMLATNTLDHRLPSPVASEGADRKSWPLNPIFPCSSRPTPMPCKSENFALDLVLPYSTFASQLSVSPAPLLHS